MKDTHQAIGKNTSRKQPLVATFIDLQNVLAIQNNAKLLIDFAKSQGRLSCPKVYFNPDYPDQVFATNKLKNDGCKPVPVRDGSKDSADRWCCFDVVKCVACQQSPDIIILVLGDSDFAGLISILLALGKKVIIVAERGSASQKLAKLVGDENFHYVDELPSLVAAHTESKINSVACQITYNEAVKYLSEAIKTASSKGKRTVLGCIGKIMRQLFPNYKGATSICKQDGKTFSRFKKFVEAAEKDGFIRIKNQELFLNQADSLMS